MELVGNVAFIFSVLHLNIPYIHVCKIPPWFRQQFDYNKVVDIGYAALKD